MALFQKNPFTAPDIKDILAEKRSAVHTVMVLFGAGIVLVSVLLGGYQIGQWILLHTVPQMVAPLSPSGTQPRVTVESRLHELGTATNTPYDVSSVVARTKELGPKDKKAAALPPSATSTIDARMKELGG